MKLHPLLRASIIISGTILFTLLIPSVSPIIGMLCMFTLMQLTLEILAHIKEIRRIKAVYVTGIRETYLSKQYCKMFIDIVTLIIWFAFVIFLSSLIPGIINW